MNQTQLENIVLVALIIVGVGLGIYFRMTNDNALSAVLFSLAFASVLYRFLGGNAQNSLTLGVIKFGGSAAVLGGFAWLLSQVIFDESIMPSSWEGDRIAFATTPAKGWYAADERTGSPIPLELKWGDTMFTLPFFAPNQKQLNSRRYQLSKFTPEKFYLHPIGKPTDTLGQVYLSDIETNIESYHHKDINVPEDVQVFKLFPHRSRNKSSTDIEKARIRAGQREQPFPFPFIIKTFGTKFSIKYRNNGEPIFSDKEIVRNVPYLIRNHENTQSPDVWLVVATHADFLHTNKREHFSEWVVAHLTH